MGSRAYHETVWRAVPAGREPPDVELRRRFLIDRVSPGERVLDVGCGEGAFAIALARAGVKVVGMDVAREPLRRARVHAPALDLVLADPDRPWPLDDASFDALWAGETLEHVADTLAWLSEARRVLAPRGRLLLSTPDHGPLRRIWLALSPRAFESHFDPRADHLRFYTRAGLARLLGEFGFDEVSVKAAGGPPGARRQLLARAVRCRW